MGRDTETTKDVPIFFPFTHKGNKVVVRVSRPVYKLTSTDLYSLRGGGRRRSRDRRRAKRGREGRGGGRGKRWRKR